MRRVGGIKLQSEPSWVTLGEEEEESAECVLPCSNFTNFIITVIIIIIIFHWIVKVTHRGSYRKLPSSL